MVYKLSYYARACIGENRIISQNSKFGSLQGKKCKL